MLAIRNTIGILKKVILVFIVFFFILNLFTYLTQKDKPRIVFDPVKENREKIFKVISDPKLNATKEGKVAILYYRQTMCRLIGEACTNNPNDADKNYKKSLFGSAASIFITPIVNPPASGIAWVSDGLKTAGFVPQAYAAKGIGLSSIAPFTNLWIAARDISYLIIVIVIVTIGFMIMFRMKLNPQTVVSIESALPKIVITLLMITFSFAIAGFLIDLMYVLIILVITTLAKAGNLPVTELSSSYMQASPWDLIGKLAGGQGFVGDFWNIFYKLPNSLLGILGDTLGYIIRAIASFVAVFTLTPAIYNFLKETMGPIPPPIILSPAGLGIHLDFLKAAVAPFAAVIAWGVGLAMGPIILNLIIGLLVFFTILFIFFRIFFILLGAYVKIFLLIIAAPIILVFNAVPGRNTFGIWFLSLVAELLTFPLLIGILIVGSIVINIPTNNGALFTPPFFVSIDPSAFSFLIGMALLFMTPDLIKLVKQLLVPKPLPVPDVGLGIFFGGASAGASGALGEVSKYASLGYYVQPLGRLIGTVTGGLVQPVQPHGGGEHKK